MSIPTSFTGGIVRAIVIEQLNADQWHATLQGGDAPAGSLEGRASGVGSFAATASHAVDVADLTGLPVLVQAYQDDLKPLGNFEPSRAFWHQRFRSRSQLDHILYGSNEGDAA